ncbi:MAG TPA: UvrD-helicase domain-containing protein [Trichococcus sp.]|nr:UvrD-helicase domain-containing protein [Trichococcus sp.]
MGLSFLEPNKFEEVIGYLQANGLFDNKENVRAKILAYWKTADIISCPGSGKTTMLTTKLAWALDKWAGNAGGICVLSHTNVAKAEIEKRLSPCQLAQLFSYPNFVGTIHEFFNRFLAIRMLDNKGIPIKFIDNKFAYEKCRESVWRIGDEVDKSEINDFVLQSYKNPKLIELDYSFKEGGYSIEGLNKTNEKYSIIQKKIKKKSCLAGYHSHNDMLAHASKLLHDCSDLKDYLSARFPLVFIDEAQDTTSLQDVLLSKVFDNDKVVVQRFGDADQHIYDFGKELNEKVVFPITSRVISDLKLAETIRCSAPIVSIAEKFSFDDNKFISVSSAKSYKPTVIIFNENNVKGVFSRFAKIIEGHGLHLESDLPIKAVGQIGVAPDDLKFPHSICHYFEGFSKAGIKGGDAINNVARLIVSVHDCYEMGRENYEAINVFFRGMGSLLRRELDDVYDVSNPFRSVREGLRSPNLNYGGYNGVKLLDDLLIIYLNLVHENIDAAVLVGKLKNACAASGFTKLDKDFLKIERKKVSRKKRSSCHFGDIKIEFDTIAGVKGETHLATLVLETFWEGGGSPRQHNVENAIRAVFKVGANKNSVNTKKRIKHLFVAMTRPTSFLCLALPQIKYDELMKNPEIRQWFDDNWDVVVADS